MTHIDDCSRCQNPTADSWRWGSHYHCGRCGEESSMMGHYMGGHWNKTIDRFDKTEGHMCCPGDCELEGGK